jgi:DNA-binding GntR family transcriptional regulator
MISSPQAAKRAHEEHEAIIAAILDGDGAKAERAMRTHIRRTGEDVLARLVDYLR